MKLTFKNEFEVTNAVLTISQCPAFEANPQITLSWFCPDCAGRNCNQNRFYNADCKDGTITKEVTPKFLNEVCDPIAKAKLLAMLESLITQFK